MVWLWLVFWISGLLCGYPRGMEYVYPWLRLAAVPGLVLGIAVLRRHCPALRKPILPLVLGAVWLWQMIVCSVEIAIGSPPTGIAGNVNWEAALLLGLFPWSLWALGVLGRKICRTVGYYLLIGSMALWMMFVLYHCHARAAWLGIAVFPVIVIFYWLKTLFERILFVLLCVVALVTMMYAGFVFLPGKLLNVVSRDVRLPMWSSTVRMIFHHPFGVGAGRFRKIFTRFRVGPYHRRAVAADVSIHPHNELLNITSQCGIIGGIAFLFLLVFLMRGHPSGFMDWCPRVSAFFLVVTAMFDMPMVQPPTDLLAYAMFGMCLPAWGVLRPAPSPGSIRALKYATAFLFLAGSLVMAGIDVYQDAMIRRGRYQLYIAKAVPAAPQTKKIAQQHFREAYAAFEAATTPFFYMTPAYERAVLDLNVFNRVDRAYELLSRIAAEEPDFAHINFLMARICLQKKQYRDAIRYFSRECALYPWNINAWWSFYAFAVETGQYGIGSYAYLRIFNIMKVKAPQLFPSEQEYRQSLVQFRQWLDEKQPEPVLKLARRYLEKVPLKGMDPLLILAARENAWYKLMARTDLSQLDYAYWRYRHQLQAQLQKSFPDKVPSIPQLLQWFRTNYAISADPDFLIPAHTLRQKRGNLRSLYYLLAEFCSIYQWPTLLHVNGQGEIDHLLIFHGEIKFLESTGDVKQKKLPIVSSVKGQWWRCDLLQAAPKTVPTPTSAQMATGRYRILFFPEVGLLRNCALACLFTDAEQLRNGFLPLWPASLKVYRTYLAVNQPPPGLQRMVRLLDLSILLRYGNIVTSRQAGPSSTRQRMPQRKTFQLMKKE
ncbi:MAG: hypothetical protein D6820_05525 [Lentisphaerae bacterium]|nr:MAG: hypothetical protein D6820_05525 [Lentisphaerota bacterium]